MISVHSKTRPLTRAQSNLYPAAVARLVALSTRKHLERVRILMYLQYVTAEWEPRQWEPSWNLPQFLQENRNSLTWVLVALTVCFTYPVLYRVSAESRAGEWEL